ncbi:MAG: HNH endonuclease signature motif containing protein, partial [Flavobacteriales bacterium]
MSQNEKWTNEEIRFLKDNFYTSNVKEISKHLGRSEKAIGTKAAKLKLIYRNLRKWTRDEVKFLKENYKIYGTKWCAEQLERGLESVNSKVRKLNLDGPKEKLIYREEQIREAVNNSICLADVMKNLGLSPKGGNYVIVKKYIAKYDIDTSHFDQYKRIRERAKNNPKPRKKSLDELLVNGSKISSSKLKERLYEEGVKERKCELCGQGEKWNGMTISLILDHINGVNNDNRWENLRIVCPNCNAGLPTHCRNQSSGNKIYFEKKNKKVKPKKSPLTKNTNKT